jgi:hypothetical protein
MDDSAKSVQQTMDGGFVLTGYTKANLYEDNPMSKVLLSKVAGNGTEEWRKAMGKAAQAGMRVRHCCRPEKEVLS